MNFAHKEMPVCLDFTAIPAKVFPFAIPAVLIRLVCVLLSAAATFCARAQGAGFIDDIEAKRRKQIDSVQFVLRQEKTDTGKVKALHLLGQRYVWVNRDSALFYYEQSLELAQKINDKAAVGRILRSMVDLYAQSGDHYKALETALYNFELAKSGTDTINLFWATRAIWRIYTQMLDFEKALEYAWQVKAIVHSGYFKKEEDIKRYSLMGYIIVSYTAHAEMKHRDSAAFYGKLAYETAKAIGDKDLLSLAVVNMGNYYREQGDNARSFSFYRMSIHIAHQAQRPDVIAGSQLGIAKLLARENQNDSAFYYGHLALETYQRIKSPILELLATTFLSDLYAEEGRMDSAYKYQSLTLILRDSLFNQKKVRQIRDVTFAQTLRQQQLEQERKMARQHYSTRLKTYGIAGGLLLILFVSFFIYRLRQIKKETQLKAVFNKKIHQIEMRALRAQMNPHFIFNCLNSINRYIVKSDHKTASSYLTKFARLIRLILDNSANELITLDKEIQTLRLYVEMEVLRFDQAFDYCIEVDEGILPETVNIPSMLLQPYVENAIWHGLLHRESGGGKLWIRFQQTKENSLIAEIEDNGIGRQRARELKSKEIIAKKSYGMQISQDRIFLINELYNINANVSVDDLTDSQGHGKGTKVTIVLPATAA